MCALYIRFPHTTRTAERNTTTPPNATGTPGALREHLATHNTRYAAYTQRSA